MKKKKLFSNFEYFNLYAFYIKTIMFKVKTLSPLAKKTKIITFLYTDNKSLTDPTLKRKTNRS